MKKKKEKTKQIQTKPKTAYWKVYNNRVWWFSDTIFTKFFFVLFVINDLADPRTL